MSLLFLRALPLFFLFSLCFAASPFNFRANHSLGAETTQQIVPTVATETTDGPKPTESVPLMLENDNVTEVAKVEGRNASDSEIETREDQALANITAHSSDNASLPESCGFFCRNVPLFVGFILTLVCVSLLLILSIVLYRYFTRRTYADE
ncbi:hypothetical protein niasHS_010487 [Heterodera schachtii]|uniref:Transmembrane protein n=1 Tax=Heterodera schachtii TaxID=97005 RepID=A0ABD2IXW8_HETSC